MRAFEPGIGGDADLAGIVRVLAVEHARAPELRPRPADRIARRSAARSRWRPSASSPAPPTIDDRPLRRPQHFLQLGHLRLTRPDRRRLGARRVRDRRCFDQHVLGQRDHDRPRTALHRDVIGALHDFGNPRRVRDLGRPFGRRAEEGAVVHLLERAAPRHRALDLADEEDHRRAVVFGDMHAVGGVGRSGAARDETDARPTRQPARRQRHHRGAGLLSADRDLDGRIVERIERCEIGFARHAIEALDPLSDELIDENLPARAGGRRWRHETLPTASEGLGARSASSAPEFQSSPRWRRLRMRQRNVMFLK